MWVAGGGWGWWDGRVLVMGGWWVGCGIGSGGVMGW